MLLLRWNRLDRAAAWLSNVTGQAWDAERILSEVLDLYRVVKGKAPPPTCLRCAPPQGTKFGRYKWDADKGTASNPFVYVCEAPNQTVALYPIQVDALLKNGETVITFAERPEDDFGRAGEYVFVEPMEQGLKVGLSSVGMSGAELQEFAARIVCENAEAKPASAQSPEVSAPSAEPMTLPPAGSPPEAGDETTADVEQPTARRYTIKARRNALDPLIDRAIAKAESRDPNAVFPVLRNMALDEEGPFTGNVEGGKLSYTDDKGTVRSFTKEALAARLKRRQASISYGN